MSNQNKMYMAKYLSQLTHPSLFPGGDPMPDFCVGKHVRVKNQKKKLQDEKKVAGRKTQKKKVEGETCQTKTKCTWQNISHNPHTPHFPREVTPCPTSAWESTR